MAVPMAIGMVDALVPIAIGTNTSSFLECRFVPIAIGTGSGYRTGRKR